MKSRYGWAGKILRVNLSNGSILDIPTMEYAPRFIGGKGIASRLYWELVNNKVGAFEPENHLIVMNGPLGGIRATAASRWIIVSKSPLAFPEQYSYGNLGGRFGAALKWVGLDGLDIVGSSKNPVVVLIEPDGRCAIQDAGKLWGKDAFYTISSLQKIYGEEASVATIGEAGEKRVRFANVIGSGGVSATKGFGAVMGSKNLKAIVVKANQVMLPVARPEAFKKIVAETLSLTKGDESGRYHAEIRQQGVTRIGNSYCYGCIGPCRRGLYRNTEGEQGYRIPCTSAAFYSPSERAKTGTVGRATFYATQLANKHGICALQLLHLINWVPQALKMGIIDPVESGLNPDGVGTLEWIETLVSLIVSRNGIGDLLAEGSRRAARELKAEELLEGNVSRTGFSAAGHDPRMYLTLATFYATEPTYDVTQIHEITRPLVQWMIWFNSKGQKGFMTTEKLRHLAKVFWGDERASEFDSPDKKGEAAVRIQNRSYAKENFVYCDWFWPINLSGNSETGIGDPSLEARLFSAVTGEDMDEGSFLQSGERCVNQCRAIYLREGRRGRIDDVLEEFLFSRPKEKDVMLSMMNPEYRMPAKDGTTISLKGAMVNRDFFKQMMDDYYKARKWDVNTGLFTEAGLTQLGLSDLLPELRLNGWVSRNE
ncbi:MAG: aldehyde ferredoxin oxidoreductase N-terminal domain-containing protein [Chloroflexota bacterium]